MSSSSYRAYPVQCRHLARVRALIAEPARRHRRVLPHPPDLDLHRDSHEIVIPAVQHRCTATEMAHAYGAHENWPGSPGTGLVPRAPGLWCCDGPTPTERDVHLPVEPTRRSPAQGARHPDRLLRAGQRTPRPQPVCPLRDRELAAAGRVHRRVRPEQVAGRQPEAAGSLRIRKSEWFREVHHVSCPECASDPPHPSARDAACQQRGERERPRPLQRVRSQRNRRSVIFPQGAAIMRPPSRIQRSWPARAPTTRSPATSAAHRATPPRSPHPASGHQTQKTTAWGPTQVIASSSTSGSRPSVSALRLTFPAKYPGNSGSVGSSHAWRAGAPRCHPGRCPSLPRVSASGTVLGPQRTPADRAGTTFRTRSATPPQSRSSRPASALAQASTISRTGLPASITP